MTVSSKETPSYLWEVLFKLKQPRRKADADIIPFNLHLSETQIQAVQKALMALDVYLIDGPPATGKTSIVVECILQEIARGNRVMVFGATEQGLDMIASKIVPGLSKKIKLCRLSHSAQTVPHIALDALILSHEEGQLAAKHKSSLKDAKEESLKREVKRLELQAIETIVDMASVVLSTIVGLRDKKIRELLGKRKYVVAVDDASLLIEVGLWIPMQLASKIILSGDSVQLSPRIRSEQSIKGGLNISLFEKLKTYYPEYTISLVTQHRMNNSIMTLVSEPLYHNRLKASDSISLSSLKKKKKTALDKIKDEIAEVRKIIDRNLLLVDTNGCQYGESATGEESKFNMGYLFM
eukprot:TRINITY_DN15078_c0_g1_i1.p1 TRINITY_DN15078_c0_g1~~TRINITY_DN15078_c0_g1_i1.p1  ORF type:complete len:352 (-),score=59.40 TRINITY_DN15078_c0_g1_i1:412-1467(-)